MFQYFPLPMVMCFERLCLACPKVFDEFQLMLVLVVSPFGFAVRPLGLQASSCLRATSDRFAPVVRHTSRPAPFWVASVYFGLVCPHDCNSVIRRTKNILSPTICGYVLP